MLEGLEPWKGVLSTGYWVLGTVYWVLGAGYGVASWRISRSLRNRIGRVEGVVGPRLLTMAALSVCLYVRLSVCVCHEVE